MKIKKIAYQHRRDFKAIHECESCGALTGEEWDYDDRNFHDNVIPAKVCKKCGKSRNDLGITAEPTPTKHDSWEVV